MRPDFVESFVVDTGLEHFSTGVGTGYLKDLVLLLLKNGLTLRFFQLVHFVDEAEDFSVL